jgi:hypothetical protein
MEAQHNRLSEIDPRTWLKDFRSHTIRTTCLELSPDFLDYLQADGIILPKYSIVQTLGRDELSDDEDLKPTQNPRIVEAPVFRELNTAIDNVIQEYNGKVFIKFHKKAPLDSSWINGGSLACQTSGDVYMLLKSSTKVAECVEEVIEKGIPSFLLIRKWANLFPSMEFRCFIHQKNLVGNLALSDCSLILQLIGICQRNCADYFDFLGDVEETSRLRQIIVNFFVSHVQNIYARDSCETIFSHSFSLRSPTLRCVGSVYRQEK